MPEYTYYCDQCSKKFCIVCSIREYQENAKCTKCNSKKTYRMYKDDLSTLNTSIKLSDSEIKTLGHLANRNAERLSQDEKEHLNTKHNSYKGADTEINLPAGMSKIKKPKSKTKWT